LKLKVIYIKIKYKKNYNVFTEVATCLRSRLPVITWKSHLLQKSLNHSSFLRKSLPFTKVIFNYGSQQL